MQSVEISEMPPRRLATVPHHGSYQDVGQAFERAGMIVSARNLWPRVGKMIGVYFDDPSAVPTEELRSAAGFEINGEVPDDLEPIDIPGGWFAVFRHRGPYAELHKAYDYLYGVWLPRSGREPRDSPALEIYLNSPRDTAAPDLLTDVCLPIR